MTDAVAPYPGVSVEVLHYAGVPKGRAAGIEARLIVLLAQRYGLDPALRHLEVIPARGGLSVYVSADGWRYLADRTGLLDGIEYPDVSRGDHGWRATCLVWKKGCAHPFEGRAGCGDSEKHDDPEAMAMTRATRRALRNGFSGAIRVEGEYAPVLTDADPVPLEVVAPVEDADKPLPGRVPPSSRRQPSLRTPAGEPGGTLPAVGVPPPRDTPSSRADQAAAHRAIGELPQEAQQAFLTAHTITDFGSVWPDEAVQAALELAF